MDEYRVFFLTPGQRCPQGSTGKTLSNGGIVWIGEEGTFPGSATISLEQAAKSYNSRVMTQEEIDEYNNPTSRDSEIANLKARVETLEEQVATLLSS